MERRSFVRSGLAVVAAGALPALTGFTSDRTGTTAPLPSRRLTGDAATLRLSANENPLGPPESARRAIIDTIGDANRYPMSYVPPFQASVAAMHGVPSEAVVLGNGSSEILQMAVQSVGLARAGTRLVLPDPTFEIVADYAEPLGLDVVKIPLAADWSHNLARMREAAESAPGALVYICNPNNPTASLTPTADVDAWIAAAPEHVVFLVDEAYIHFVDARGHESMLKWTQRRPNVIVTRTFSKIYGMAGLRLGYAVAHPDTIRRLASFASDVNTNHFALQAGRAALHDDAFLDRARSSNAEAKSILLAALDRLEIETIPSQANFVMHRIRGELKDYIAHMRDAGAQVGRPFPPMLTWNRVSIGTPAEMRRFVGILESGRRDGWA